MTNRSYRAGAAARLCLELGEDDGLDPKYIRNKTARKPECHKTLQLCKEATRLFGLMLGAEISRPLFHDLRVLSVEPTQNGKVFVVTVVHEGDQPEVDGARIIAELNQVHSVLRWALAQAIHRKNTPRLTFIYAGITRPTQGGG